MIIQVKKILRYLDKMEPYMHTIKSIVRQMIDLDIRVRKAILSEERNVVILSSKPMLVDGVTKYLTSIDVSFRERGVMYFVGTINDDVVATVIISENGKRAEICIDDNDDAEIVSLSVPVMYPFPINQNDVVKVFADSIRVDIGMDIDGVHVGMLTLRSLLDYDVEEVEKLVSEGRISMLELMGYLAYRAYKYYHR